MGRPPLPIGTYGKIRYYETASGWRAIVNFRDFDGKTRPVERVGGSQAAARRKLKEALRDRARLASGDGLTRETRFDVAAEMWLTEFQVRVDAGDRSETSKETYEQRLNTLILPAIGAVRLEELSVPRLTALCRAIQQRWSASTARTVRTVLSGVCGLAVRHGAMPSNPVRDVPRLEGRKVPSRALSVAELTDLLKMLDADKKARECDLPDLIR